MKGRCLPGPHRLDRKKNPLRRRPYVSDRCRRAQATMYSSGATEEWTIEISPHDGQHTRELARVAGDAATRFRDCARGQHQRLLCDERAGGSGLERASALGAHRRDRQPAEAEIRSAGCEAVSAQLSVADRDPLPEAWFPPAMRELRLRARQRCWLTVMRSRGKNRLSSLLQMHGLRAPESCFTGK